MRILFLLFSFPVLIESLKILFYVSAIAQSHIPFHNTAINLLLERGHIVDLVVSQYNEAVKVTIPKSVRRKYSFGFDDPTYWSKNAMHLTNVFEKKPIPWAEFDTFDQSALELCKIAVGNVDLFKYIQEGEYDIGISSDYDPCANIIMHAAGVPVKASMIPTPMFQSHVVSAGLPSLASLYGTTLYPKRDTSFYNRVFDLLRHTYNLNFVAPKIMAEYNRLAKDAYGFNFPDVEEIERNVDIVLANSNEIIEKPRPISSKIKYIGGMGKKKAKPLSTELNDVLESANRGVVIFSFGTQVNTNDVPIEIRKNFITAFKSFPDHLFLWKYDNLTDNMELFKNAPNIHRYQWLPQTDLLGDERVKAFISHMGLNSFLETAAAGVPVLAIPLFIDQQHNSFNAVSREMGVIVDRDQLTSENLILAIRELLYHPKYERNAKTVARMMVQKPEQAEKLFVEWIEYAANNPGLHKIFNLPGAELNVFWYYCIDVVLLLVFIIVSVILFIVLLLIALKKLITAALKPKQD